MQSRIAHVRTMVAGKTNLIEAERPHVSLIYTTSPVTLFIRDSSTSETHSISLATPAERNRRQGFASKSFRMWFSLVLQFFVSENIKRNVKKEIRVRCEAGNEQRREVKSVITFCIVFADCFTWIITLHFRNSLCFVRHCWRGIGGAEWRKRAEKAFTHHCPHYVFFFDAIWVVSLPSAENSTAVAIRSAEKAQNFWLKSEIKFS